MNSLRYPHLIVRAFSTMYIPQPILFEGDESEAPFGLRVPIPPPQDRNDVQPAERAAIFNATLTAIRRDRMRRCVIFSADERVYLEEDGSADSSKPAPSGGPLGV